MCRISHIMISTVLIATSIIDFILKISVLFISSSGLNRLYLRQIPKRIKVYRITPSYTQFISL